MVGMQSYHVGEIGKSKHQAYYWHGQWPDSGRESGNVSHTNA